MHEDIGDLWSYIPDVGTVDARIIPTNGITRSDGSAVMGRGLALQAASRFPALPHYLGKRLMKYGNHSFVFSSSRLGCDFNLVTFPTKHHWNENSDIDLIIRSAVELANFADDNEWRAAVLPRVGCGEGHLEWAEVSKFIKGLLDERFYVVREA